MARPTNAEMIAEHERLAAIAQLRPEWRSRAAQDAARLCANDDKQMFVKAAKENGVPWWFIAVTKEMEAGPDAGFLRSIAQGDPWNRKSTNVPRGRGPFNNWFEATSDALNKCAPYAGHWQNWSLGGALTISLLYNGLGYWPKPSPYLFSGTTVYSKGKFTSDGRYDPEAVSQQLGVLTLLLEMKRIDPSVAFGPNVAPRAAPTPPKDIVKEATKTERKALTGAIVAGAGAGGAEAGKTTSSTIAPSAPLLPSALTYTAIGVAIAVSIAATVLIARKTKAINDVW